MPSWFYFARPTHLAFHDFTRSNKPQKNLRSLLGLGLKFIPTPRLTHSWASIKAHTFDRFVRTLRLRFWFAEAETVPTNTTTAHPATPSEYNPRMYLRSGWTPPHWHYPSAVMTPRLAAFEAELHRMFRQRTGRPNLLPHQQRALTDLQSQRQWLIVPCDKNLGPSIIESADYLRIAYRDHLHDSATYRRLRPAEIELTKIQLRNSLQAWLTTYKKDINKPDRRFLEHEFANNKSPFARFYLTLKAHKLKPGQTVDHLKSRPIVSCPGSLLHPLGVWIDSKLQPLAKIQRSYFKNSFVLRQQLVELVLPPNARLFTADAVSMYTNIPTNRAAIMLGHLLRTYQRDLDHTYPVMAVLKGLSLVMRNNVFTFGDCVFRQLNGTAMGTSPAPPYATLYYAAFENDFLSRFEDSLLFYRRFIDDVFGVWLCHADPAVDARRWQSFITAMNTGSELEWEVSERSSEVDFMDLHLSIVDDRTRMTLFEKPLNLHLYIPPHSAHAPGLLPGMINGSVFRIFTLCSDQNDRQERTRVFFRRLLARGYKADQLRPLFHKAISIAQRYTGPRTTQQQTSQEYVIFHLPFHPNDPKSTAIQRAWRQTVATPPYKMPLQDVRNPHTRHKCGITRMIIAYKRPMNLGNLLSHRNLDNVGPTVSSFFPD